MMIVLDEPVESGGPPLRVVWWHEHPVVIVGDQLVQSADVGGDDCGAGCHRFGGDSAERLRPLRRHNHDVGVAELPIDGRVVQLAQC